MLSRLVGCVGENDGYRIWIPNEQKIVLSRDVTFKPEVMCNSRNDKTQTDCACPTIPVATTEASGVLENYKSDHGNTASTSGGSNGSNSEIHVQDRKSVLEKKQPNWMSSGEFVCLVNDIQGGYCVSPNSYNETIQSNEQKQWL
jgi:hypothetical protein